MRRVVRRNLSARSARILNDEQRDADKLLAAGILDITTEWKRARRNNPLKEAFGVLRQMAGNRERCMYCGDSHGTDIEHFWPKAPYPARMFRWTNMLLCCNECGWIKGDDFPIEHDEPLLIDPASENPWEFLDFDPRTGTIVPRYDQDRQQETPKGQATVRVLELDRREAMARGYRRSFRHIMRTLEDAINQPNPDIATLIQELSDADDHGLLGWIIDGTGRNIRPFVEIREHYPALWHACLAAYQQQ